VSHRSGAAPDVEAVVFDLGGVVIGWEPERAFAGVLPEDEVATFLTRIDFPAWNRRHDGGLRFDAGEAELVERFPADAAAIRAYRRNFAATLTGMVPGTSAIIAELQQAGVRLVALTNWSAETFPAALDRFGILRRFEGIVVSGTERVLKPDPAIFSLTLERYGLIAARTVFIDDVAANVAAARSLGLVGLDFTGAGQLRTDLGRLGLLGARGRPGGPVLHLALATDWAVARDTGGYPWSTRGVRYEAEGYVHCSFPEQVHDVRRRCYPDRADDELVVLQLRPDAGPIVVEDLGAGRAFPHLYAPLDHELVARADPYRPPAPG
jgi:2-haloacid dehalogenase